MPTNFSNRIAEPARAPAAPVERLLRVALLAVLLAAALLFTWQSWRVIVFPYPVDYGEGPLLDQTARLARLENIYDRDLSVPPFTVANYPPLYPALLSPVLARLGPAFWYGRLLSWLSIVVSALLVAGIVRSLTGRRLPAAIAGLTLPAIPYVVFWAPLYRIDALALCLSLAGLFVLVRRPEARWTLPATAALFVAAVFTRQSYLLAAPLAAFVFLFARDRSPRRALRLAALTALPGAALLGWLETATHGGFLFHTWTANVNGFSLDSVRQYAAELVLLLPGLAALALVHTLVAHRLPTDARGLVTPYLIGSLAAAFAIGKTGSNVNYLLELSAALALATGALLAGVRGRAWASRAVSLVLLLQVSFLLGGTRYQDHLRFKLDQRPELARLMRVVHEADGEVLADEALGLLALDGRPVHAQPFELVQLARAGAWDQTPLLGELERQEFAAVLIYRVPWSAIDRTRWTPEMLRGLERRYAAAAVVGQTVIYRPRKTGP